MEISSKHKAMTEQLRLTHSDEEVAEYIRSIIISDTARDYWVKEIKERLRKQYMPMLHPIKAVAQATIENLDSLMKINNT